MWAPLLALQVSSTGVAVLLFSLFSPRLALFSSLSVLHTCKAGECGSGRMTHLLHTSSLLGHIWAARKSILLRLCSGEEQAMQGHYEDLFSTFSFLLHCFSEHGPLIWAPRTNIGSTFTWLLDGYFQMFWKNDSSTDVRICMKQMQWIQDMYSLSICLSRKHTWAQC